MMSQSMLEIMEKNGSRCSSVAIPSIPEYLSAINVYGIILITLGTLSVILVLAMSANTLSYIMKHSSSRVKAHSAFVIGVYPVIALACYFAILVPRAHLLAEALTQGVFMFAMYQLFCLFVAYCGGEAELVRKAKPTSLNLKVAPCCCWPCCFFLPSLDVTKKTIRRLRLLVLQLPAVQGLAYLTLLIMWAERESLYQINYLYIQPVIITSIVFGIWSMAMTIDLLKGFLGEEYAMRPKFIVLQMVLIFAKLQGLITRCLVWTDILPCKPPVTPAVYANLLHNCLMLVEMILLTYIAGRLYKKILPDDYASNVGRHHVSTIGTIMTSNFLQDNNNYGAEDLNLKFTLEKGKTGQVNIAVDVRE